MNKSKTSILKFLIFFHSLFLLYPTVGHSSPETEFVKTSTVWLGFACSDGYEKDKIYAKGFCDGFIEAVYNSVDIWCVPSNVTHSEINIIVRRSLIEKRNEINKSHIKYLLKSTLIMRHDV